MWFGIFGYLLLMQLELVVFSNSIPKINKDMNCFEYVVIAWPQDICCKVTTASFQGGISAGFNYMVFAQNIIAIPILELSTWENQRTLQLKMVF